MLGVILLILPGGLVAAPGDLDSSFGAGGKASIHVTPDLGDEWAHSVAVQADGKILLGGYVNTGYGLVRYNSSGTLDSGFGTGGRVVSHIGYDSPAALAIQLDGKIVLGGSSSFSAGPFRFSVARHNTNGTPDLTFGGSGNVTASFGGAGDFTSGMVLQSDGKIVLGGYSEASAAQNYDQTFALVRFNTNGTLDSSFSDDGKLTTDLGDRIDRCSSLALQSDGKIIAAGYSGASWALVRYNTNGSLDTSFDGDGKLIMPPDSSISAPGAVAVQTDGKILLAGMIENRFALLRINTNGSPDTTFGTNGRALVQAGSRWSGCTSLEIQRDGKIIAAGVAGNANIDFAVVRLNSDGTPDATFGRNGIVTTGAGTNGSEIHDIALQRDGKILATGRVWNGSYTDFGVVRYEGDTAPSITLHPRSQFVTTGVALNFTVEASGTLPLYYQWLFNGTNIVGANDTTLTLTNLQIGNAGTYSVLVTNYLGSVTSSNAVLSVNRPPVADASATRRLVVSVNNSNANAVLDGSLSSDPDGDPLRHMWLASDGGTPLATGVVAIVTLPLGTNTVILEVNDGLATDTDSLKVDVVTPTEAVRRLLADVERSDLSPIRKLLLRVHLKLAERFFERNHPFAAIIQLERFKQKVRMVVEPQEPELANQWIAQAQFIVDAVKIGMGGRSALEQLSALVRDAEMPASLREGLTALLESAVNRGDPNAALVQLEQFQVAARTGLGSSDLELSQVLEAAAQEAIEDQRENRGRFHIALSAESRRVSMRFSASPGLTYCIEASSNLLDWEMIGVAIQNVPGEFEYEDPSSDKFSTRFYRLVLP